jgi:Tfp pilus assembly protein PilX
MKTSRTPQQGAAALAVVMILLLAMTILAAFANRSLIFEQRSSANQYRSTIAAETAEAGLEWAQALLNDGRRVDAHCRPAADQPTSFRERYVPKSSPDAAIAPVTTVRPGCSLGATGLVCHCPDAGGSAEWTRNDPSFTVEFAAVTGDPEALRKIGRAHV